MTEETKTLALYRMTRAEEALEDALSLAGNACAMVTSSRVMAPRFVVAGSFEEKPLDGFVGGLFVHFPGLYPGV